MISKLRGTIKGLTEKDISRLENVLATNKSDDLNTVKVFQNASEFEAAGGAAANPGPVWIDDGLFIDNAGLSATSANLFNGGAVRIVRNLIAFDRTDLHVSADGGAWTAVNSNGTYSYDAAAPNGKAVTCTATAPTARTCIAMSFNATAGQKYAARCKVTGIVGTPGSIIWTDCGASNSQATLTADGYVGIVFTADLTQAENLRFGLNPGGATGNAGDSVTISEVMLEAIPSTQSAPSEYVPPSNSASFAYPIANTLVSGSITDVVGTVNTLSESRTVLVMGDSMSNNSSDFPQLLQNDRSDIGVVVDGRPGAKSVDQLGRIANALALTALLRTGDTSSTEIALTQFNSHADKPAVLIYQLIVNDILQSNSTGIGLSDLKNYVYAVKAAAKLAGVKLIITDCPPFATYASSTASKLLLREAYNAWLSTLPQTSNFRILKLSRISGSPTAYSVMPYDLIQSGYDSGDHLHPNTTGGQAIADGLKSLLY